MNWPLLILTDSPEFPRKLNIAGMVKMCDNEDKVTNKRFDGNWGNLYTSPIQIFFIFLSRGEFDALRLLVYTYNQGKIDLILSITRGTQAVYLASTGSPPPPLRSHVTILKTSNTSLFTAKLAAYLGALSSNSEQSVPLESH